jgi:hypothetical protein
VHECVTSVDETSKHTTKNVKHVTAADGTVFNKFKMQLIIETSDRCLSQILIKQIFFFVSTSYIFGYRRGWRSICMIYTCIAQVLDVNHEVL